MSDTKLPDYMWDGESIKTYKLRVYGVFINPVKNRSQLCMFMLKAEDNRITWNATAMKEARP